MSIGPAISSEIEGVTGQRFLFRYVYRDSGTHTDAVYVRTFKKLIICQIIKKNGTQKIWMVDLDLRLKVDYGSNVFLD